jgi:hypothetical protein
MEMLEQHRKKEREDHIQSKAADNYADLQAGILY